MRALKVASLPANLFVDTPEMEDASLHHLGNDPTTWPEDIIQKLKERVPQCEGLHTMVKFMKKDEENGAATGSITIHSDTVAVVVPIIIKDFMMYPLDVMIAKQKLVPLTPDYFNSVFTKENVFDKLEEFPTFGGLGRFEDANLWNAIYPPSLGRYAYASAGYDILDAISDTIDGAEFQKFLRSNEKVAARLLTGPHKEVVTKLANLRPVNMNEFRQGVENLIPRSVMMLTREGGNKYNLLSNADSVFHPLLTGPLTRNECMEFVSKISDRVADDINEVDQNGEKMLMLPPPKDDVILARTDSEIPEEATEYDHYSVKTVGTGVNVEGVVIPKVIDFDMKLKDMKLFVGKTLSTYQDKIYGVRIKNSRFSPKTDVPRVGQTGCFFYQPDMSHGLATVPVTITAIEDSIGQIIIHATDLAGIVIRLKLDTSVDSDMQRIAMIGPRRYLIPKRMKWLPLEGFQTVSNSEYDYAVKQAAARLTDKPVTIISTGYDHYSIRGVGKYASAMKWDATNLLRKEAKFLLASLGCPAEKIASALKQADVRGSSEVHNLRFPPLVSEKIAMAKPLAEHLYKKALALRSNLIKEASYLENSQTVDALLSLNFITPANIAKFVAKIPNLKASISHLASLLIGSRLGVKEIPERSVADAMQRMIEVVDGLEKLKAMQGMGV